MTAKLSRVFTRVLAVVFALPALAASASQEAPAVWVRYAEELSAALGARLQQNDDLAVSVRIHLHDEAAPDAPPPLQLRLWFDAGGAVRRAEFPSLGGQQADADLEALLLGFRTAPPPPGMRQPLRLEIRIDPVRGDRSGIVI